MRILTLLTLAGVLAGCASTGTTASNDLDQEAIARAERSAMLGGAQLKWVNYPRLNQLQTQQKESDKATGM